MLKKLIAYTFRISIAFSALIGINFLGVHVGVNFFNAFMIGCMGIPGICSAVAVNFIL